MNKISGLGLSILTVFSLASMSSNVVDGSVTSNTINSYYYESISIINDESGELCLSSDLNEWVVGDILEDKNNIMENSLLYHEKKTIKLKITNITEHISKFDFEEEYEEI